MYELLALYAQPFNPREPVVCIDEKSLQLLGHSRAPLPMSPGVITKEDYEYVRGGTSYLFVAIEPKAGQRVVSVTERRGKVDFVEFIVSLLGGAYAKARRVHIVLDNLNIHFRKCFDDVLGRRAADRRLADRQTLQREVDKWQHARNATGQTIEWKFTRQDADRKPGRHYVPLFTC